jgi:hypothetical protein
MIINTLIALGLIITPFIVLTGYDTRMPKMAAALVFALALSLWVLYKGHIKPFANKWVLIFIGYLLLNIYLSPKPDIILFDIRVGNIWVWQSVSYIIIFSLMLISTASIEFKPQDIKRLLNIMVHCGLVMAVYCILQALCLDQFFKSIGGGTDSLLYANQIAGTLGNPTIAAPFMAMLIPLALYLKRYIFAVIMALATILTMSQVGIGAMAVSLLFYFAVKSKRNLIIAVSTGIIAISAYAFICPVRATINDSYRFGAWKTMTEDMVKPNPGARYPITGIGTGSFGYTFHVKHARHEIHSTFIQAHNEYLELFWNTGLVGLDLFLCAMFYVWKQNFSIKAVLSSTANQYRMALLSSFLCISICAGGTFVFQIGTTIFYTILIVGLLTNTSEHKEEV